MARPQRIEIADAFYHVSNSKKPGKPLFPSNAHAAVFLEQVQLAGQRFNVEVHGWSLQKQHYQLLVKTPEANLSRFMRQVDGLYTLRFKQLQGRHGSVFKARYRSVLLQPMLAPAVLHYLHHGAVKKRDSVLGNHQSSLPYYLGQQKAAFPVIADQLLGNGERARKLAREQQTTSVPLAILDFFARKSRPAILGDDSFRLQVRHQLPRQPAAASRLRLPGRKRPALSRIVASVATVFTVSEDSIVQAARGPGSKNVPRWVAMHLCQEVGGVTLQVIADHFGLQRYGTVSTTIGKLRDELPANPRLQSQLHKLLQQLSWR